MEVYARASVLVDQVFEKAGDWDTAVVTLTFANGAMGAIDNSRKAVYGYDQRVEVFGSEGMVAVANNTPDYACPPGPGGHCTRPCRSISSWSATRNPTATRCRHSWMRFGTAGRFRWAGRTG